MVEVKLNPKKINKKDNTTNVEMSTSEIAFVKHLIKKYNPKKIVEVGVSAGGNTVNLLNWKDKNAQLFSIDISTHWYKNHEKLSGWMADELNVKNNWKIYRGYDYLDVHSQIGNDIDFIIIDTVHSMPGEVLTFLAVLPQLKDGCIVILHDIHLNMALISENIFGDYALAAYCSGLLFGGVSSDKKWTLKSDNFSNIGAFVIDNSTRKNIKDIFHILCSAWFIFPYELNLMEYSKYVHKNYSVDCQNLFNACLKAQFKCFNHILTAQTARVDIINTKNKDNTIEFLNIPESVDITFPDWFKTNKGYGAVIQTREKKFDLKLKCINDGLLEINLRGPDVRNNYGKRTPGYVNFNTFKINNKDVIKDSVDVWHDDPYIFKKYVRDGEIIAIHIEWSLYKPQFNFEVTNKQE